MNGIAAHSLQLAFYKVFEIEKICKIEEVTIIYCKGYDGILTVKLTN